jgi:outer membrane receptor protein involved in Fe transport
VKRLTSVWISLFAMFGGVAFPLLAQVNTASIVGTVQDSAGAVVAGTTIEAHDVETGATRSAVTNGDGSYSLQFLPIGSYTLTVRSQGFATIQRSGVTLVAAQDVRLDFNLQIQNVQQTVEVASSTTTLDTVSSQDSSTLAQRQVDQLPLAHLNWTNLLTQTTGAIKQTSSSSSTQNLGLSLNGLPTAGFSLTVDGTNAAADPEVPIFGFYQSPNIINTIAHDAIQEVSIVKGVPPATLGGAMSGGINILTKSGTNRFHGDLFELNEISALDARNYFTFTAKPRLTFNQFGGALGGPILKDKLFFFVAYEGARESLYTPITGSVPTAYARAVAPAAFTQELNKIPTVAQPTGDNADCYGANPNPTDTTCKTSASYFGAAAKQNFDSSGVARIDQNINDRNSWYARYTRNRPYQNTPSLNTTNPQITTAHGDVYNAGFLHQFRNITSDSRFGYNRLRLSRAQIGFYSDNEGIAFGGFNTTASEIFIKMGRVVTGDQQFAMNIGKHSLQFGFIVQRNDGGRLDYQTAAFNYSTLPQFVSNTPNAITLNFDITPFDLYQWQLGGFAQDNYRLTQTLTLNLGLRYDYYTVIKEVSGRFYNHGVDPVLGPGYGDYYNPNSAYNADFRSGLQPRLGFAWAPTNTGAVVRGAFGIMTDRRPFYGGPIEMSPSSPSEPSNLNLNASQVNAASLIFPLPHAALPAVLQQLQASGAVGTSFAGTSLDRVANNPYAIEWALDVEQELPARMVLDVGYVGNHGLNENFTYIDNLPSRVTSVAPRSTWGNFNRYIPGDKSNYEAMQVKLTKRTQWGLGYGANYTWAHSLSFGDANILLETSPQDLNNLRAEYGPSQYDIRDNFSANVLWDIPFVEWFGISGRPIRAFADGWRLTSVINANTGLPVNINNGKSVFAADRPDLIGNPYNSGAVYHPAGTHQFLNKAAFGTVPLNSGGIQVRDGDLTRNSIRNIGQYTIDMTAAKHFTLPESTTLDFHIDAFNLMNHTNFTGLVTNTNSGSFGTFASATSRTIQLGAKFNF